MKALRARLTYANVTATLALFLVLAGGSALAAKQVLPKNAVGSRQIKDGAVTAAKIKDGAVTGSKIQLSSLGAVPDAVHAAKADGAQSAEHARGADRASDADHAGNADHATSADRSAPGFLCVYTSFISGMTFEGFRSAFSGSITPAGPEAVLMIFAGTASIGTARGSWAYREA